MPNSIRHVSPGVRSTASSQSSRDYQVLERKHWKQFFVPGRIFMYQLHESELDHYSKKQRLLGVPKPSPKPVYRRCVVVKAGRDTSQCLCIKTYEGEGCTRKDVRSKQHHHAVVYTSHDPYRLPEETHLRTSIQADPISHDTTLPRLARLNYDSLFELSHTRPIYPLAQVTNRSLETLLYDFEELNPPTIRPFHQTRKRTWDVLLEQFDTTTISPKTTTTTPASRPIRSMRRAPTFPSPIPETVTRPPPPQQQQRQVKIVAPRQEHTTTTPTTPTTPFPIRSSRAVHLPVHLFSARPGQPAAAVSALLDTRAELNFIDAGLAERLGATKLRYGGPDVAMPGGGGDGAALPAHGAVKARWRFDGRERSVVDAFVVLRGLPAEVVLGRAAVVARRWGVGDAEAEALGLPPLGRDERRKMEQDDRHKSELTRRREAQENAEIERRFAQQ